MTSEGHRTRITQACISCKVRKKKCNRGVPSCSYCIRKDLDCRYVPVPRRHGRFSLNTRGPLHTAIHHETLTGETSVDLVEPRPTFTELVIERDTFYRPRIEGLDGIYLEAQNIIRSTGKFVDDLTARYFRNFHSHLPIISRVRFQNNLISTGSAPSADASVLLLTVCLLAYLPSSQMHSQDGEALVMGRQSLYLATKALVAQAQGSLQPSIPLIQATLLLATYEYANGKPEAAVVTIAGCARMAYAARIHDRRHHSMDCDSGIDVEEAGNTWWGIVIFERAFLCETDSIEQPMATVLPPGDTRLPIDRDMLDRGDFQSPGSIPNIPVSCLTTPDVGGFGRAAQASCLLDQVLKGLVAPDLNTRLPLLESLDRSIQSLLAFVLNHRPERDSPYCTALSVTLSRLLFKLHSHILDLPEHTVTANLRSLEDWKKSSLAALDTATTIVIDMSKSHYSNLPSDGTNNTSPVIIYVVRAAIQHIQSRPCDGTSPWSEIVETELQLYLDKLRHQWVASHQ
ncbi:hypothetical protein P170DRAFT_409275 [Aspergillus steynii IBT 23096]|uniref:Zn(2)-C6 fungal-type domain-containing protein n=1 Tax=Aspergillus steynii IBT 23096 TaxID=1392250 RepID=A0A2I2G9Z2_9EURO|nr:uncharacterized protein P170DRAFT_409275 [Aspergillus steynii IBT 23096]PLB49696.1 hypothetical protein P170DRAFT_409275 [Aspergillus steynii IBT 23096]